MPLYGTLGSGQGPRDQVMARLMGPTHIFNSFLLFAAAVCIEGILWSFYYKGSLLFVDRVVNEVSSKFYLLFYLYDGYFSDIKKGFNLLAVLSDHVIRNP